MAGGDSGDRRLVEETDVDHYAVLGLPSGEEGSKLTVKEIEKAYRNQSRLRHPDKRPDDPNATADFQLLTSSFEVLKNEDTRRILDAKLRSRRELLIRDSFLDAKRRKMTTDLEDRERAAAAAMDPAEEVRRKERMKADELKREIAEFQTRRSKKDSHPVVGQENKKEKLGTNLDKQRILKVSWEISVGEYGAAKLREIFERFGTVEDVVIRSKISKKKASAIVVMASREAAVRATQSMSGDIGNPLLVLLLDPISAGFSSASGDLNGSVYPKLSEVVGAGFQDYEASIMKKLQKANEKKKDL
ncbi:hypothetical protein HPP92_007329 [Vanilla planifolia]|uniref:J domain-containing protein n=1 Tax=Vanilla planifolia TaxID=51239 RepID=A0A835RDN7_VANPL|nr:hypothetical protein HPP92_007329 [Vanilla planifolia]